MIFGDVTSDDTSNILTVSGSNRQYSRFDAFDLTLALTQAAILSGSGHEFEGWSIANSQISDEFIETLFQGPTSCTGANPHFTTCGVLSGWQDGDLGLSHKGFEDFWAYLSTEITPSKPAQAIGFGRISPDGTVADFDDLHSITSLDSFSIGSPVGPINLLLYRDIPEPSVIALFIAGLLGFGFFRRRRYQV